MRTYDHHFISEEDVDKLEVMAQEFVKAQTGYEPFIALLKEFLPVHKTDQSTWKRRVEGFYEVSDSLFSAALDLGQAKHGEEYTRGRLVVEAKMRPFSYYHWITGSREPVSNVLTRSDYLNDATTALVKLEDDIMNLCQLLAKLTD